MSAARPGRRLADDVDRVVAYDCQVQDVKPEKQQPEGMRSGTNHPLGCGRAHLQALVHGRLKSGCCREEELRMELWWWAKGCGGVGFRTRPT